MRDLNQAVLAWRKSTFSNSGDCVEAASGGESVFLRDSKDPYGPMLTLKSSEWSAFLVNVRNTELNQY
jgi:hypothetical protein